MVFEPSTGIGAEGHHDEALLAGTLDGGGDETATESPSPERRRDLGVDQDQAPAVPAVDELGSFVVSLERETMVDDVVYNGAFAQCP